MADKPRGRGALLEKIRLHKEAQLGVAGELLEEAEPPKSRGRAALLKKLQDLKDKKAGIEEHSPQLSAPIAETSTVPSRGEVTQVKELPTPIPSEPVSFKGQTGTPLRASVNYIYLHVEQDRGMFEYEVRFSPDVDAKNYRRKLLGEILRREGSSTVQSAYTYDGDVCLYLPSQLFSDRKTFDSLIPNTDQPVKVVLTYKRKRKMHESLHLYNVLFKKIMHILLYNRIGRNYFSHEHKSVIQQHKLEVIPGFAVHVDEMEGGLMLCMDTQHRVIRCQTVYEMMQDLRVANPRTFLQEFQKAVVGSCILTRYNNATYTVDDISPNATPKDTFELRTGGSISYIQYYKQQYNINVEDYDQPLLVSKTRTRNANGEKQDRIIFLIPELCYLTGLSDAMRSDFKVMKDVAAFTRVTPQQRALALRTYLDRVRKSKEAQDLLAGWGLKLAGGTAEIPARVLPPEGIYFGGPNPEEAKQVGGGDWNKAVTCNEMTGPIDIMTWQLYYTRRDQKYAANFAETLCRLAKGMGCIIKNPQHVMLDDDRTETYMTAIQNNVTNETQVAVFICPTLRTDRYSIIKKMCCINKPIASQVVLSKTLANPQKVRTIIHKIGMQITCKLGGTLWSVKIPASQWMVCGIDVYHGANKQSVCGFVSSINQSMTKYFNDVMFQGGEIGDFLKMAFRKSLQEHKTHMGSTPKRIIVFRDGVGDGQLEHCKRYEVEQFLEVIRELKLDATLSYIIVQKRINTRIFKSLDGANCENPPSGTVVDSIVTRRNLADFFLVPQSVRQGTVNPTHYIVLHDDCNFSPDHLQRLAYKLCHLYFNWSGTVRVPAPCLYAHKLASLVGQYVKKVPDTRLSNRLYYL